jgi:hypothetical protein
MKVRMYPNGGFAEFGAERFEVEWQELTASAKSRYGTDGEGYEHDRDNDEVCVAETFATREEAMAFARRVVDDRKTVYGAATVVRQRVQWFVEEDRVAEWADVEEPEYVD